MNQPLPKISVVCAWYNRADYIQATIDSLLAQDYGNFDITVVNDGSPDPQVKDILDGYNDPRLRVIHQQNAGFTQSIRMAIQASDGEYIAIQGAGDISLPKRLSAQMDFLTEHSFSLVGCLHALCSSSSQKVLSQTNIKKSFDPQVLFSKNGKLPFTHGSIVMKRKIYDEIGGYDTFFEYSQDRDLYCRILAAGKIGVLDRVLYQKYIFPDGASIHPSKKMKQKIFHEIASYRRDQIELYKLDENNVDSEASKNSMEKTYLKIRLALGFAIKGELAIALEWVRSILTQLEIKKIKPLK